MDKYHEIKEMIYKACPYTKVIVRNSLGGLAVCVSAYMYNRGSEDGCKIIIPINEIEYYDLYIEKLIKEIKRRMEV